MPKRLYLAPLLLPTLLRAQTRTPDTLRTTTTLVQVPTLVRTPTGDLVHTLSATDFRLTDNGIPQAVTLEDPDTQSPITLLVLLQTGGAAIRQFPNYPGIATMLQTLVGRSPCQAALVTFDSQPEEIWPFYNKIDRLSEAFRHPPRGDTGAALYDALNTGIDLLESPDTPHPPGGRRILILISQQADAGSKLREQNILTRLGETDILVYTFAFSPEEQWLKDQFTHKRQGNPPYQFGPDRTLTYTFNLDVPLRNALKAMRANVAAELATLSGGESFSFGNRQDLERQFATLANHIPNRYLLTFRPTTNTPGLHTLTVQIPATPQFQISARTTYWTPTPAK